MEVAKSETQWTFVEAGSHWRNGIVERQIQAIKVSLGRAMEANADLNFAELDVLCSVVANTINQRPLGVRILGRMMKGVLPQMTFF